MESAVNLHQPDARVAGPAAVACDAQRPDTLISGVGRNHCCFKSTRGNPQKNESGSKLESDVIYCIRSLRDHVQELYVSQALPRTPNILFLNLTLRGGRKFCVEVTHTGWRVTSLHHDSMDGDISSLMLHIRYFDSLKGLIDYVSAVEERRDAAEAADRSP